MNHKHRKILQAIFAHPVSANIDFKDVVSVLEELGAEIDNKHGIRIGVKLNGHSAAFSHAQHDLPIDLPALEKFHAAGRPIFGTCAGLILVARDVSGPRQFSLGFIDVGVERNAYGRQRESFEARGTVEMDGRPAPVEMVFIRAPRIRRVGEGVQTLARHDGEPVMARQGTVLVATFHPELTDDSAIHRYFCRMVEAARA